MSFRLGIVIILITCCVFAGAKLSKSKEKNLGLLINAELMSNEVPDFKLFSRNPSLKKQAPSTNDRTSSDTIQGPFTPDWGSLDSRQLPEWYEDAKFGIFIHWGVFSVPSFGSEWFWWNWKGAQRPEYIEFMKKNYRPDFSYADFATQFTAEFYDPKEWANIFQSSGAKYIVLTSKHHEGYTLWPSKYSWNWNAMDVGPKRNVLGDLAEAIRNQTDLKFGLYHSLYEWFNPLYLQDKAANFQSHNFVRSKTMPELYELVNQYQPSVIWSDGEWEAQDSYWNATNFLAWLYNESPVKDEVVVNDRWGSGILCKHGDFYTCTDRYNPGVLQAHKWENCLTIDGKSWGYRRNAPLSDYKTAAQLIKELAETVSCGGNMLLNVGPTHDGRISPIFEERLRQIGEWMSVNGQAIYSSRPWTFQNDTLTSNVWYTMTKDGATVYAIVLFWPSSDVVELAAPQLGAKSHLSFLGSNETIKWEIGDDTVKIHFPPKSKVSNDWAWVVRMNGVLN